MSPRRSTEILEEEEINILLRLANQEELYRRRWLYAAQELRQSIAVARARGAGVREIARTISRNPSSISRLLHKDGRERTQLDGGKSENSPTKSLNHDP